MGNESTTTQETQYVLRRLEEALRLFGRETDPRWFWILVLIVILGLGVFYVISMYRRDSQSVGWGWASFLAGLRCLVYFILAAVFLLPAEQTWERTQTHSKAVVALDVSGSLGTRDDPPTDSTPIAKLPTRQDKVIQFLTDERINFIKTTQEKNPVYLYRFGNRADEEFKVLPEGEMLAPSEWAAWLKPDPRAKPPDGLDAEGRAKFQKRLDFYSQLVDGTNLGDSLLEIINRESNNMVQGLIVISDGRSTQYSAQTFEELRARAHRAKVPIFTVVVGEMRQPISIRITDLQAPEQARPEDKFPIRVEVDGEGLPDKELVVMLDVTNPQGQKHTIEKPFKFNAGGGGPPHAQIEYEIDAAQLGVTPLPGKKAELEEGSWTFQARVPRDKREIFVGKEHGSDKVTVKIVKKPLRVLLFAGAPTRDFQFVRSLLVREVDQHRAELSICLQMQREGVIQDVPPDRFLRQFPYRLGDESGGDKAEERYYNLSQYDLIIAFDPDWNLLQPEQFAALERWINLQAGGLILVAGPVNTYQLARLGNRDKIKPILDLFPVLLKDSRLEEGVERSSGDPWRLHFPGASAEMEFLKLDEAGKDRLAGWEDFFTGKTGGEGGAGPVPIHGFYSYYPVESVKPSATVIATFSDPRARLHDGAKEQPYLVTMPYGSGRVVYLGSGETWRLRQHNEVYFERFWTKLARFVGSGNLTRISSHGNIVMGREFGAGQIVHVEAQLFGRDLKPLAPNSKPKAQIKSPAGAPPLGPVELEGKPTAGGEWAGWFQGHFRGMAPGEYRLDLQVPESGDLLSRKFVVKESNPELDNTRPDFGQMYQLASEITEVLPRMDKPGQDELRQNLESTAARLLQQVDTSGPDQPKASQPAATGSNHATSGEKEQPRLFFDLASAHLIPKCLVSESKVQRSRGPVKDLWDLGLTFSNDPPVQLAHALVIVVGLLSVEWLTRKLLKLA
jgi:hypothetical protein